jgi:class 3 adenylate cyclase
VSASHGGVGVRAIGGAAERRRAGFFEALREGDAQAVSNRVSRRAGFERFGSDPVTIAFTDIQDSTRLNDLLGDKRWLDVLRAHNDVTATVTTDHGGTIVKNRATASCSHSRRRAGRSDAPRRSSSRSWSASTTRDPLIRVRIGIHVGETVREADDFFGHAVSYAARIASQAGAGEVVVSSLVHDLTAQTGEFEFGESRVVQLKGISGSQRIYSLVSAAPVG